MGRNGSGDNPFECVEPEIGLRLPLLEQPGIAAELRKQLEDHLEICDACRLEVAAQRRIGAGLRSGALSLGESSSASRPVRRARAGVAPRLGQGGVVALAAGIALAAILPPQPKTENVTTRSIQALSRFARPVEGEVLLTGTPRLTWTAVPGATAYELQVWEVGGDYRRSFGSPDESLHIPDEAALPRTGIFRALVRPVPADLEGPAPVSVSFRRAGLPAFLGYRLGATAPAAWVVAGVGAALIALALALRWVRPS